MKKDQYKELHDKGYTYAQIARVFGVTHQCVRQALNWKKKTQPRPHLKSK